MRPLNKRIYPKLYIGRERSFISPGIFEHIVIYMSVISPYMYITNWVKPNRPFSRRGG